MTCDFTGKFGGKIFREREEVEVDPPFARKKRRMRHPAAFARCPRLKPQFNQAVFRGLKAPAPSGKTGARAKEEADSSAALRNDKQIGCGMTDKVAPTLRRFKRKTMSGASPEVCGAAPSSGISF